MIFEDGSFFLDDGKAVLIDEFGKDYGNYFSILSLIASSKSQRGKMESILQVPIGAHLDKYEVKRNGSKISLALLKNKSSEIAKPYHNFATQYKNLSLGHM